MFSDSFKKLLVHGKALSADGPVWALIHTKNLEKSEIKFQQNDKRIRRDRPYIYHAIPAIGRDDVNDVGVGQCWFRCGQ